MTFTKNTRRRFEPGRTRFILPPLVASPMLRLLAFALVALAAAVYGLVRHYTTTLPPMRVLSPSPAPTFDADAGEMPVPDMYLSDGGGT